MTYLWRIHLKLVPFLVIGLIEVGYALTSGPAMPEYTSFEPVESTDLVNLSSGEFVYTLPVMTVPGPGLGFPIVLNYHSGILQRQEATWVGLGWNLQAGAITRQVNKLPDDFKGDYIEESIKGSKVHGWAGSISYCGSSIGISWDNTNGLGGMVAASFRYEYFQMSTRIGVNGYYEGVSTSVGVGYGGENVSAGLAIGISSRDGVSINPSLGVNVEGTANFSGSASLGTSGMMGSIGLSLGAVQVSLDGSGRSSTTGSSWYSTSLASSVTGKMHNEAIQHGFDIPTQLGVFSLGLTNWSSWLQGIESNFYYGFLYSDRVGMDCAGEQKGEWNCAGWNNGGDTWKKKAEYLESLGPWEDWKARRAHGRMMATSEDAYIVSTQGVQGVFKPFRKEDGDYANVLRNGSHTSQNNACPIIPVRFCDKDHSVNRTKELTQSMDILNEQELSNDVYWRFMDDPGGAEFTNKADREATATVSRQAKQIIPFFKGSKIAGFQIVKEDGVRYNYTKALHNIHQTTWGGSFLGEYSNGDPNEIFTTQKMPTFAYTWLLTGIMGPDYAKLGPTCPEYPLCSPENGDLGQWVRFTYDAGTSGQPGETALYGWGTPYYEPEVGTIPKTEDAKFLTSNPAGVATAQKDYVALSSERSSIHGLKEIAFLRTVETPTHRADFEISTRLDGRQASVSQQIMVPGENVLVDEETDARLAKPPENGGALSQWQSHFLKEQKTIAKIATGKQPGTKVNILVKHKDFLGSLGNGFDFGPSWTKSTFVLKEVPNLTVDNSGNVSVPYTFPVYTNQPSDENGDTHKYFLKPDVLITPGPGSGPINPIPGLINLPVVTKIGILDLTSPATPRWPYQIRPECGEVDYSPTNSHLAFLKYRVTRKFKAKVPETFPIGAHVTLRANHSVFVQNSCNHNQIVTHNKDFTVNAERTVEMEFDYDNQDLVNEFQTNENGFVISTGYLYRWKAPVHFYFIIKGEAPMKKLDRIVLRNKAQGNVEVSSVEFKYDYSLVPGTPNSKADNNGKLTLASLRQGAGSQGPFLHPYTFTYHDPNARYQGPAPAENAQGVVNNRDWVPWEVQQYDRWGYRCETCSDMEHSPKEGNALAWNLKEISVPSGGKISIEYEQNRLKYLMGEDGAQPIVLPRAGTQDESEILIAS